MELRIAQLSIKSQLRHLKRMLLVKIYQAVVMEPYGVKARRHEDHSTSATVATGPARAAHADANTKPGWLHPTLRHFPRSHKSTVVA